MLAEVRGEGDRTVCVIADVCVCGASTDCETAGVSVKSECVVCVSGEVCGCVLCEDGEGNSAGSEVLYLRREEEDEEEEASCSCWCCSGFGFSNEK